MFDKFKIKLSDFTLLDYIAAGILIFIGIGLLIFLVGFLFTFDVETNISNIIPISQKTSVLGILRGKSGAIQGANPTWDTKDLFTLMGTVQPSEGVVFSMVACSISGFSIMMIGLGSFILFIVFGFLYEYITSRKEDSNA